MDQIAVLNESIRKLQLLMCNPVSPDIATALAAQTSQLRALVYAFPVFEAVSEAAPRPARIFPPLPPVLPMDVNSVDIPSVTAAVTTIAESALAAAAQRVGVTVDALKAALVNTNLAAEGQAFSFLRQDAVDSLASMRVAYPRGKTLTGIVLPVHGVLVDGRSTLLPDSDRPPIASVLVGNAGIAGLNNDTPAGLRMWMENGSIERVARIGQALFVAAKPCVEPDVDPLLLRSWAASIVLDIDCVLAEEEQEGGPSSAPAAKGSVHRFVSAKTQAALKQCLLKNWLGAGITFGVRPADSLLTCSRDVYNLNCNLTPYLVAIMDTLSVAAGGSRIEVMQMHPNSLSDESGGLRLFAKRSAGGTATVFLHLGLTHPSFVQYAMGLFLSLFEGTHQEKTAAADRYALQHSQLAAGGLGVLLAAAAGRPPDVGYLYRLLGGMQPSFESALPAAAARKFRAAVRTAAAEGGFPEPVGTPKGDDGRGLADGSKVVASFRDAVTRIAEDAGEAAAFAEVLTNLSAVGQPAKKNRLRGLSAATSPSSAPAPPPAFAGAPSPHSPPPPPPSRTAEELEFPPNQLLTQSGQLGVGEPAVEPVGEPAVEPVGVPAGGPVGVPGKPVAGFPVVGAPPPHPPRPPSSLDALVFDVRTPLITRLMLALRTTLEWTPPQWHRFGVDAGRDLLDLIKSLIADARVQLDVLIKTPPTLDFTQAGPPVLLCRADMAPFNVPALRPIVDDESAPWFRRCEAALAVMRHELTILRNPDTTKITSAAASQRALSALDTVWGGAHRSVLSAFTTAWQKK